MTRSSYKDAYVLAKHGKRFTDGEIAKDCLLEAVDKLCGGKSHLFNNLTLAGNTVARRVGDMGKNIMNQLPARQASFATFQLQWMNLSTAVLPLNYVFLLEVWMKILMLPKIWLLYTACMARLLGRTYSLS